MELQRPSRASTTLSPRPTDFVVATLQAEACRVIEQNKILKLELEDSEALVNALLNPPKPNEALKAAALRYKKEMSV